jgi:hypothetical protein
MCRRFNKYNKYILRLQLLLLLMRLNHYFSSVYFKNSFFLCIKNTQRKVSNFRLCVEFLSKKKAKMRNKNEKKIF